MGSHHEAEDVLQDAVLIALRKLDKFDPATAFSAWMGQIVRNVALNHARKRARDRAVSVTPAHLSETPCGRPAETVRLTGRGKIDDDQSGFDDRVLTALGDLDDTERACLLLRIILDMSYREISRALGIPTGTAMSHVHRARQALRETLFATSGITPCANTSITNSGSGAKPARLQALVTAMTSIVGPPVCPGRPDMRSPQ